MHKETKADLLTFLKVGRLLAHARRVVKLWVIADEIRKAGGKAEIMETDETRHSDVKTLIDRALSVFGRVDVLGAESRFMNLIHLVLPVYRLYH